MGPVADGRWTGGTGGPVGPVAGGPVARGRWTGGPWPVDRWPVAPVGDGGVCG